MYIAHCLLYLFQAVDKIDTFGQTIFTTKLNYKTDT